MKFALMLALCCVAAVKGEFLEKMVNAVGNEIKCALVKEMRDVAQLDGSNVFEQIKLNLLVFKCNIGLKSIDDGFFLFISYILIAIIAIFILKLVYKACCGGSKTPTVNPVYKVPPYSRVA